MQFHPSDPRPPKGTVIAIFVWCVVGWLFVIAADASRFVDILPGAVATFDMYLALLVVGLLASLIGCVLAGVVFKQHPMVGLTGFSLAVGCLIRIFYIVFAEGILP